MICTPCKTEVSQLPDAKATKREYDLLKKYAITSTEYGKLLEAQNGVCWICHRPPAKFSLAVDHQHEKGEKKRNPREIRGRVRGLLCWSCNNAIAKLRDDPEATARAAEYLRRHPAQEILRG